jgi:hypothetical protein
MAREIVKQVKNAVLYADGTIRVDNVRLSYPSLARPKVETDDEGNKKGESYCAVGLMPKKTHGAAKDLIKAQNEKLMKENDTKALPSDRKFMRDGDQTDKPENEGMYMISAREKKRPSCRGRDKRALEINEIENVLYPGCWVNLLIRPWFQDNKKYGKRVNANLIAVQFVRDDEQFGEGRISEDDIDDTFDDIEDEDDGGFEDDDEL